MAGTLKSALTSAAEAAASAAQAAVSAAAAAASAVAAALSETNASTSETNAGTSETNAGNSETAAAASESAASTSETNAAASETAAAASAASVNIRTINKQAGDYTIQTSDRNKLVEYTGAGGDTITLATTATLTGGFEFHLKNAGSGSVTVDANAVAGTTIDGVATITLTPEQSVVIVTDEAADHFEVTQSRGYALLADASTVSFTPAGDLAATDVQAMGEELDAEKAALAGSTAQAFACSNIAFPATQVPSADPNTLDDYEEGTFSPIITGAVSASGQAYSEQSGWYTKIGNFANTQCAVTLSTLGTITGEPAIGDLPFIQNASAGSFAAGVIGTFTSMTTSMVSMSMLGTGNTTKVRVRGIKTGAVSTDSLAQADLSATTRFVSSYGYRTA